MFGVEFFEWVVAFLTLTALEIVLGFDNVVILSILVDRLPKAQQPGARRLGLFFAFFARVVLLMTVTWLAGLSEHMFTAFGHGVSPKDLMLFAGGLFLIAKATTEIYSHVELHDGKSGLEGAGRKVYAMVIGQIIFFDVLFSFDSILTAVGLSRQLSVMIPAVFVAIVLMIVFADWVGHFVHNSPSIKLLALAFVVCIGVLLIGESLGAEFNRNYVYFSMAFSLIIELLNTRRTRKVERHRKGH